MTGARELSPPYATTDHLLGDRVVCVFCDRVDFQVRFIAEDTPLCEDCEAYRPELWEGEDE